MRHLESLLPEGEITMSKSLSVWFMVVAAIYLVFMAGCRDVALKAVMNQVRDIEGEALGH